jgi:hypothetical protein
MLDYQVLPCMRSALRREEQFSRCLGYNERLQLTAFFVLTINIDIKPPILENVFFLCVCVGCSRCTP